MLRDVFSVITYSTVENINYETDCIRKNSTKRIFLSASIINSILSRFKTKIED